MLKTNKVRAIFVTLVVGLVGLGFLINASASTSTISFELESQMLSGCSSKVNDQSASGYSAVRFNECMQNNTGPLPFKKLTNSELKSSKKKVFAHYFTPYPLQINNVNSNSDYYQNGYLNPDGENGKHAEYGGFLRERPLPIPVNASLDWQYENMKTEVRRATSAGLDGFAVDILGLSGYNWDRFMLLLRAANEVDKEFKIMLMPDGTASATTNAIALAEALSGVIKGPYADSLFKVSGGGVVVSPFAPERRGLNFWNTVLNTMKSDGITVAFVPCFLDYTNNASSYASISYGSSNWGNRNPDGNRLVDLTRLAESAKSRGQIWMQPVSVQDSRPASAAYWEANNTENLRATWEAANANAEWVQIPTWNDYSENAQISPSTHIGWSLLDLNAYFISKFKTGASPTITKDVLYLSHRTQFADAIPTGGQTILQTIRASTPARNKVEVISFLRSPSQLSITVGGVTNTVSAPAGVSVHTVDLRLGSVSAKATIAETTLAGVTSPFPVVSRPEVQDLQYYFSSSARGNQGIGRYNDTMDVSTP